MYFLLDLDWFCMKHNNSIIQQQIVLQEPDNLTVQMQNSPVVPLAKAKKVSNKKFNCIQNTLDANK